MKSRTFLRNYTFRFLIVFFFCISASLKAKSFDAGLSIGWGYDSWELSSEVESDEMAALQLDFRAVLHIPLLKRFHVFPEIGGSYSMDSMIPMNEVPVEFGSFLLGSKFAWVLHPDFCPFIGTGIYAKFYNKIIDEQNIWVYNLNLSAGSKILRLDESDIWVFLDYGLWNSKSKTHSNSFFILSFAYLLHF